jgi:hypothetical protein
MSFHGFPKGMVFQASSRYNNKVMSEEDVNEFFARAAFGGPAPRGERVQMPKKQQKSMDIKVHRLGDSPNTSPTNQEFQKISLLGTDQAESSMRHLAESNSENINAPSRSDKGKGKVSAQQFLFGNTSKGQHEDHVFSFKCSSPGEIEENTFCKQCQVVIKKSRAIGSIPSEGARGGFGIYIEGENDGDNDRLVDVFSQGYGLYPTFEDLYKSAEMGCHLCSLLACPNPEAKSNPASDCKNVYTIDVYQQQKYDGPGKIEIQVKQYERKTILLMYDYPKAKLQGPLRYRRTDTEQVFSLALDWLKQCQTCHSECQNVSKVGNFVPARLLDISTGHEGTVTSIRLRVISTMSKDDQKIEYLALSHCWGGVDTATLEMSTFAAFQTSIPLSSLPKNFLDAAIITVKLGFKYLWIDSLCIIQDSPLDQAREIPTMGSVYGRAVLTIAALGAENSHGGCFTTRNPLSLVPALLRDGDSSTRDQVWAWSQKLQDPSTQGPTRQPLHKRGWVVQERALAPRTLSFGKDMVYWECLGGVASEAVPVIKKEGEKGLKIALMQCSAEKGNGWEYCKLKPQAGIEIINKTNCDFALGESFWWDIVHEYSTSKLTKPCDKWNAISALARRAEEATTQLLYYGLWECNIFEESLWKCDQPGQRTDPTDLDVPTWSWLSVDAPVNNKQRFNYERDFDRVAAVAIPPLSRISADGLGRLKTLIIRGPLLSISWSTSRDKDKQTEYSFQFTDHPILNHQSKCDWFPDVVPEADWRLSAISMVVNKKGGTEACGLVVKPNDASDISWTRVGMWKIYSHENDEADILGTAGYGKTLTLV